jgi:hypothetical protein
MCLEKHYSHGMPEGIWNHIGVGQSRVNVARMRKHQFSFMFKLAEALALGLMRTAPKSG